MAVLAGPTLACGGHCGRAPVEHVTAADGGHGHGHGGGPLVHRFRDAAQWAREFDDPARDAWQKPDEVVRLLAIEPGMTVADLGAGTGYFMKYLSRAVGAEGHVLALDIETSMVDYMRQRAARESLTNVEPRLVPFDDPQLGAGSVHRVLIVDTWHHIPERPVYSAKLRDALAVGGTVTVVDFVLDSPRGPPAHARILPEEVVRELEAAGLRSEIVAEDLTDQYVVRGTRL